MFRAREQLRLILRAENILMPAQIIPHLPRAEIVITTHRHRLLTAKFFEGQKDSVSILSFKRGMEANHLQRLKVIPPEIL